MIRRLRRPGRLLLGSTLALALAVSACSPSVSPSPSPSPSPAASASASPAGAPSASPSPSPSSASEDIAALTAEISAQVASLRGLALEKPVKPEIVDEQKAKDVLKASFEADNTPAYLAALEGLFERLGLLPAGSSLESLELELLASQVLGFYDPVTKQLYVVARSGGVGATERYTMAHEITHALQDQHFDLHKVTGDAIDQTDRTAAARSIVEGDASLAGTLWASQHLSSQDLATIVAAGADPAQQAVLTKMPPIVKDPLLFYYTQGLQLTLGLYQAGGWAAVDKSLGAPPASTEQVLHPEKYAAHEAPVAVSLPSGLAAKLGAAWHLALEDTFGELELRIWLQSSTSSAALATDAAGGWGGDRVGYLTGPDGKDAAIIWTAWDTTADADQFLDAAGRLIADGASPGTVIRASDRQVAVIVASESVLVDEVAKAAGFPIPQ